MCEPVKNRELEFQKLNEFIQTCKDLNKPFTNGHTILSTAIFLGDVEICKFLLKNGASVIINEKINHITQAVNTGNLQIVSILLYENRHLVDEGTEMTPLMRAVKRGDFKMCELLLSFDADINKEPIDYTQGSPLYTAVISKNEKMVRFLISKGARVNRIYQGRSLLSWSCYQDSFGIFKELLKSGADVNQISNSSGNTPLISLLTKKSEWTKESMQMFNLLFENKANPNLGFTIFGDSALSCSIVYSHKFGKEKIWELLLRNGANINSVCGFINSPLYYSILFMNQECCKCLLKLGANTKTESILKLLNKKELSETVSIIKTVRNEIKRRDERILMLILLSRKFSKDSVFYEDLLPLDLLKEILRESLIDFTIPRGQISGFSEKVKNFGKGIFKHMFSLFTQARQ